MLVLTWITVGNHSNIKDITVEKGWFRKHILVSTKNTPLTINCNENNVFMDDKNFTLLFILEKLCTVARYN